MNYGAIELQFAEPFAEALVAIPAFRTWVLRQTKFEAFAEEARLLHKEMKAHRSATAKNWWRSHFTDECRCPGCKGQETDLLAIFEIPQGFRFALHVEVKQPKDRFKENGIQAASYPLRAHCWSTKGTLARGLPHSAATTALLFSETQRTRYGPHLRHFETLLTFEETDEQLQSLKQAS